MAVDEEARALRRTHFAAAVLYTMNGVVFIIGPVRSESQSQLVSHTPTSLKKGMCVYLQLPGLHVVERLVVQ